MSASQDPITRAAHKAGVALGLTFAAGYVDVVGYLALYQIFAANMTGNTVHFASGVSRAHWSEVTFTGLVILAFFSGSILGRSLIELGARRRAQRIASVTLLIEAAMVAAVIIVAGRHSGAQSSWLLMVLAVAMGVQTATLTRIGPLTVHTTFVTGMLNKLAQLVSHTLFLSYDLLRGRGHVRPARQQSLRRSLFIFSIWVCYFAGALFGARAQSVFGLFALVVPVAVLAGAAVVDQVYPLSLVEEQDEIEAGR